MQLQSGREVLFFHLLIEIKTHFNNTVSCRQDFLNLPKVRKLIIEMENAENPDPNSISETTKI